jgi:hypothetical protein
MKIKCVIIVIVTLLMPYYFLSCNGNDEDDNTKSGSGILGYYTVGQIGTNISPWGDGSSSHKPAVAVKITPQAYPITINSVNIYVQNTTGSNQMFNLRAFSENLSSETDLFSPKLNEIIPNTGTTYIKMSISIPSTVISSGSFYIVIEWVNKPLNASSGSNSFFLCTDTSNTTNTNYWRYAGTMWETTESIGAPCGDFGIEVNY